VTVQREVGFGLVGGGRIGRWHAKQITSLPGLKLVAIADNDKAAAERSSKAFQVPVAVDIANLLDREGLDVVLICTPPATHADLIEQAALSGKHILVEKPMALDLERVDEILETCAAREVILGVVHQQRAQSACKALKTLVADDQLGKILFAVATHAWYRKAEGADKQNWRHGGPGSGLLYDQAIHAIDLLIWLLGDPIWVTGTADNVLSDGPHEDRACALIGFAGGAMATLAASSVANRAHDDITIDVSGTRGGARLEIRDYDVAYLHQVDQSKQVTRRATTLSPEAVEALIRHHGGIWRAGPKNLLWRMVGTIAGERGRYPFASPRAFLRRSVDRKAQAETGEPQGHAAVLQDMAEAVRNNLRPIATGADARKAIAVIDAIYRSSRGDGRPVSIATIDPR
jgi:UDP-N-acetyl-2-amino-2-deoxyglucuronate dehydrogenase